MLYKTRQKKNSLLQNLKPGPAAKLGHVKGIIHYDLLGHGRTITAGVCCQQFDQVKEAFFFRKCPALVNRKTSILQHVNVMENFSNKILARMKFFHIVHAMRVITYRFLLFLIIRIFHQ